MAYYRCTGRGAGTAAGPPKFLATQIFWAEREIWANLVFKEVSKSFYYIEEIDVFYLNQLHSQETVIG